VVGGTRETFSVGQGNVVVVIRQCISIVLGREWGWGKESCVWGDGKWTQSQVSAGSRLLPRHIFCFWKTRRCKLALADKIRKYIWRVKVKGRAWGRVADGDIGPNCCTWAGVCDEWWD